MKRFKTVLISFALLIGLNPIAAYANPQTLGGWLFLMQYAVDHCYLNGTIPGQRIDIILNADQILIDIGAESMASELAKGYQIQYRWNGWEWKENMPNCGLIWQTWGPRGHNWLKRGGINAEWLAQQALKQTLTNREKELKTAPAQ